MPDRTDPRLQYVIVLALVVVTYACGANSDESPSPTTARSQHTTPGRIAFVSQTDGNQEIYTVNADGTGLTNFTQHPSDDGDIFPDANDQYAMNWSPNGECIAFESARDTWLRLFVRCTGESSVRTLTKDEKLLPQSAPVWSPDGGKISFIAGVSTFAGGDICVITEDGSDLHCFTGKSNYKVGLSWSPNGAYLAFLASGEARVLEVHVIRPDGSDDTSLADNASYDSLTSWSPDSSKLLYNSYWGENADIYSVSVDSRSLTRLTDDPAMDLHAAWSPDGRQIAFSSRRSGSFDIYLMDSSGSDLVRLTDGSGSEVLPSWSPDGERLAFVSAEPGGAENNNTFDIWVVNVDGSNPTLVAENMASYAVPLWAPIP